MACRTLGACRFGGAIDREFGEMMMVKDNVKSTCPNLFSYVRYNPELTRFGLDGLGLTDVDPGTISKLDSVANIPDIQRVGVSYAARSVSLSHLKGFV